MSLIEMRVEQIDTLTPRIRRLQLARVDGNALPAWEAGAHIEIHVPADGMRPPLRRAYSLVRPGDDNATLEIAVQHEPAGTGGSAWMHGLTAGDVINVSPPKNEFPLTPDADTALLLAGGIGITPVLSMALALRAQGRAYDFHYAARSADDAAYWRDVEALGGRCWFDGGDPANGVPLLYVIGAPVAGRHLYVCGPKGFIQATLDAAKVLGWPDDAVHCELFAGALDAAGDQPFTVELKQSGVTLAVPVGSSVMDVMEAHGLDPMFDCRRGECGICTVQVLSGEPDHRDICLSTRERSEGGFCTCVSRARSPHLVLDI